MRWKFLNGKDIRCASHRKRSKVLNKDIYCVFKGRLVTVEQTRTMFTKTYKSECQNEKKNYTFQTLTNSCFLLCFL